MAQQPHESGTVTRRFRTDVGTAWWVALVAVPLVLGLFGRGQSGGFWSVFLWSVVAFVVGALVAHAIAGALVKPQSEAEAFADLGDQR